MKNPKKPLKTEAKIKTGVLDISTEGVCPKTGEQMELVKLTTSKPPQYVWYSKTSRIALPMTDPKLI